MFSLSLQEGGLIWTAIKLLVFFFYNLFREKLDVNIFPPVHKATFEILCPQVALAGRMWFAPALCGSRFCPRQMPGSQVQGYPAFVNNSMQVIWMNPVYSCFPAGKKYLLLLLKNTLLLNPS